MIALRQIHDIKNNKVLLNLPLDFKANKVEIIVLPFEDKTENLSKIKNILLSAPTLSRKELQSFESNKRWIEKWGVKKF